MSIYNLFRKIINKWRLKICLENLDYAIECEDRKVDINIIEASRQILLNIKSYIPDICTSTYRNSIQFQWENKNLSYMEFEIYNDCIKCMIVPYFGRLNPKKKTLADLERIVVHESFPLQAYKYMDQVINDFMNEKYDKHCKLD